MNRDELYGSWDLYNRYENFLRLTAGPERYKLLWDIRNYLDNEFGVEFDDSLTSFIKECIKIKYEIYNINSLIEEMKHVYFGEDEQKLLLTELFYIIVFAELKPYNLSTFKFTLKKGLIKFVRSHSKGKYARFVFFHEEVIDTLINDFTENLEV
ncbi:MAG: hypothetical protein ACMG57_05715 [Candidatus Dojkabacteria bacterium]